MQLSEVKVVITGGGKGLGAATARYLAGQGARVTIFDLDAEAGQLMADGHEAIGFEMVDVTDEAAADAAIEAATSDMGGLNAAINCAGIAVGIKTTGRDGPHPLGKFRQVVDVNLVGSFNVARLAAAAMSRNAPNEAGERGVIINTASIAAFEGQKGQVAYAASKAGVAGMALPMARDLAGLGIRVCSIAPGIFLTPMLQSLGPEIIDGLAQGVTFPKRLGRPEEYAHLAGYILQAEYLNGETIRIDGALRMQ